MTINLIHSEAEAIQTNFKPKLSAMEDEELDASTELGKTKMKRCGFGHVTLFCLPFCGSMVSDHCGFLICCCLLIV